MHNIIVFYYLIRFANYSILFNRELWPNCIYISKKFKTAICLNKYIIIEIIMIKILLIIDRKLLPNNL